jgi:hypothetical protein
MNEAANCFLLKCPMWTIVAPPYPPRIEPQGYLVSEATQWVMQNDGPERRIVVFTEVDYARRFIANCVQGNACMPLPIHTPQELSSILTLAADTDGFIPELVVDPSDQFHGHRVSPEGLLDQ